MSSRDDWPDQAVLREISETCVNFRLRRIARILNNLYDDALRPAGLKSTQYNQLVCLDMMGETTVKSLAKALAVDRTSLSRSLEPLERLGLVSSRPGIDGRERLVQLTLKGRGSLRKAIPLWEATQATVNAALGAEMVETLFESARVIEKALGPEIEGS